MTYYFSHFPFVSNFIILIPRNLAQKGRKILPMHHTGRAKSQRRKNFLFPTFLFFWEERENWWSHLRSRSRPVASTCNIAVDFGGKQHHKQLSIVEVEDTARTKDPKGTVLEILNCQKKTKEEKPSLIIYKRKSTSKYLQLQNMVMRIGVATAPWSACCDLLSDIVHAAQLSSECFPYFIGRNVEDSPIMLLSEDIFSIFIFLSHAL